MAESREWKVESRGCEQLINFPLSIFLLLRPHRTIAHRRGCGIRPYASIGGKVLVAQVAVEVVVRTKIIDIINKHAWYKPNAVRYGYAG